MESLFWLIRLPVTLAFAALAAALPLWFALGLAFGVVVFAVGATAIPLVMVKHAWTGNPDAFRSYLRGLVEVEKYISEWWKPYSTRWTKLGKWQETGRLEGRQRVF